MRALRILDFDCEARPLSWYGGDLVSKEVTAIAAQIIGSKGDPVVWALGEDTPEQMLEGFLSLYDEADMVTGHFIRGYDLPVIAGALVEFGLPPLDQKLSSDTKLDLPKLSGWSKSQESLGAMLGLHHPKVTMTQDDWREANRLTKAGIAKTKKRVAGDVTQHMELRKRLLDKGLLGRPKVWTPSSTGTGKYSP